MDWLAGRRLPVVGVLVAVVLAATGYLAGRLLQTGKNASRVVELTRVADCTPLGHECGARANGVAVGLRLDASVSPLRPFDVAVTAQGVPGPIQGVSVNYIMTGMNMGRNRYRLTKVAGAPQDGPWKGRSTLPVCSESRLDWMAIVTVETRQASFRARFPFRAAPLH